jgi:hypothetical protein
MLGVIKCGVHGVIVNGVGSGVGLLHAKCHAAGIVQLPLYGFNVAIPTNGKAFVVTCSNGYIFPRCTQNFVAIRGVYNEHYLGCFGLVVLLGGLHGVIVGVAHGFIIHRLVKVSKEF